MERKRRIKKRKKINFIYVLFIFCMFLIIYNNYKYIKTTNKNIISIQNEIKDLKESQTYILLELKESEQEVKQVKSTLIQSSKKIDDLIDKYSEKYNIDKKLAHSIALVESGKNQNARNGSAIGIYQIKSSTAKGMGINNVYDTESNIEAGIKYLAYLKNKFNNDETKIISAYNAGPNAGQNKGHIPNPKYVQKVKAIKQKL